MFGSLIKEPAPQVLTGEDAKKVRESIFTMLWMASDCRETNRLVGSSGEEYEMSPSKVNEDNFDKVDEGFLVWTGSAQCLADYVAGKDTGEQGEGITVIIFHSEGSVVAEFDWESGEVRLWLGTPGLFWERVQDHTQAW